jgi:hypothetical protein
MSSKTIALRAMTNNQMQAIGSDLSYGPISIDSVFKRELLVREFQEKHGLSVDGWPGNKTYYSLWIAGYRPSMGETIVSRAQSWCHIGTTYALSKGGYEWLPDFPAEELDCSGFIASVLGRSRKPQLDFPYWLSTDSIWTDCGDKQRLFKQINKPIRGCLVVYPDDDGKQGHVSVVSAEDVENGELTGIDCASSSSLLGDAISERNISFFLRKTKVRFCLPVWLQG